MTKLSLYLLPGTMCDATLWRHLGQLKDNFELHFVAIPKQPTLAAMVAELADTLPEEPCYLMGFSLGGYVSSLYAKTHPHRVKKLMVLANSPCSLPESELAQRRQTIAFLEKFQYKGAIDSRIQQLLGKNSQDNDEMIAHIQQMERNVGLEQIVPQLKATSIRDDLSEFFQSTAIATSFVYGDEDVLVNPKWFENLNNPHVSVRCLHKTGHMSPLESPEKVIESVIEHFL